MFKMMRAMFLSLQSSRAGGILRRRVLIHPVGTNRSVPTPRGGVNQDAHPSSPRCTGRFELRVSRVCEEMTGRNPPTRVRSSVG